MPSNDVLLPTITAITEATRSGPSPNVMKRFRLREVMDRPGEKGYFMFDDFRDYPLIPTETTQIGWGKSKVFASSGSTVVPTSVLNAVDKAYGGLKLTGNSDNDAASIAQAYPGILLSGNLSDSGVAVAGFCIARDNILTNASATAFGLAETNLFTLSATVPLNAGDGMSNGGGFLGFNLLEDGLGVVNTCRSDRATATPTNIQAAVATMVANAYKKFEIVYDPNKSAKCVSFFVDNVEQTTYVTKTALQAFTYIGKGSLGLLLACCADSAASQATYLKWWYAGQMKPGV